MGADCAGDTLCTEVADAEAIASPATLEVVEVVTATDELVATPDVSGGDFVVVAGIAGVVGVTPSLAVMVVLAVTAAEATTPPAPLDAGLSASWSSGAADCGPLAMGAAVGAPEAGAGLIWG